MLRATSPGLVLYAAVVLGSSVAIAQEDDLRAKAIEITRAGADAYTAGHYSDALARFQEAYRLVPAPPLMLNLSRTHLKLDHCDEAVHFAQTYEAVTPDAEARSWLADVGKVCVAVEVSSDPAGASVTLAGMTGASRVTPWSGYLRPRDYDLTLHRDGFVDQRMKIQVAAGKPLNVVVKLVAASTPVMAVAAEPALPTDQFALPDAPKPPAPAPAPQPAAPPPAPAVHPATAAPVHPPVATVAPVKAAPVPPALTHPPVTRRTAVRRAGWVTLATGAAALVTAVVLGATVQSDTNALGQKSSTRTGSEAQSDISSINGRAAGANVLFGVGGGLAAGGALMVVVW